MSGGTHVHVWYSLIMIDPLRQGYKKEGRVKKKGVEPNLGEGNTREKTKGRTQSRG